MQRWHHVRPSTAIFLGCLLMAALIMLVDIVSEALAEILAAGMAASLALLCVYAGARTWKARFRGADDARQRCPNCGYEIGFPPRHARCPECGRDTSDAAPSWPLPRVLRNPEAYVLLSILGAIGAAYLAYKRVVDALEILGWM